MFYLETKIFLLATIKYRWCAYLSPPFFGISRHKSILGGFVVPLVDVECPKKCTAMVKIGLSRFQKPIGKLASVYHR